MKKFSSNFLVGAATAAHQVEGGNVNSDYWVQEQVPHSVFNEPSLDAVDHYHRYEEDIRLLAEAGGNAYRFSIEWARIQPGPDCWEEKEIRHYRDVLKCCHECGITPVVTMMHFSSPKWLIPMGGWENPQVAELFAAYCGRIAAELGDQMEYVCTINEANMRLQLAALMRDMMRRMAGQQAARESDVQVGINMNRENMMLGMEETARAFGLQNPEDIHTFVSQCTPEGDRIVMQAHKAAKVAMKRACPHLKLGLTLSLHDIQAQPGGEALAAKEWDEEFLHYLPDIIEDDFLGVQCYTRKVFGPEGTVQPGPDVPRTQMGYEEYPQAAANVVRKVAEKFPGELIVTENGIATDEDERRCGFIQKAAEGLQECIQEKIPLKGYFYWSLLDNFEWQKGYAMTFGVIGVDRSTQKRYPKKSLKVLGSLSGRGISD